MQSKLTGTLAKDCCSKNSSRGVSDAVTQNLVNNVNKTSRLNRFIGTNFYCEDEECGFNDEIENVNKKLQAQCDEMTLINKLLVKSDLRIGKLDAELENYFTTLLGEEPIDEVKTTEQSSSGAPKSQINKNKQFDQSPVCSTTLNKCKQKKDLPQLQQKGQRVQSQVSWAQQKQLKRSNQTFLNLNIGSSDNDSDAIHRKSAHTTLRRIKPRQMKNINKKCVNLSIGSSSSDSDTVHRQPVQAHVIRAPQEQLKNPRQKLLYLSHDGVASDSESNAHYSVKKKRSCSAPPRKNISDKRHNFREYPNLTSYVQKCTQDKNYLPLSWNRPQVQTPASTRLATRTSEENVDIDDDCVNKPQQYPSVKESTSKKCPPPKNSLTSAAPTDEYEIDSDLESLLAACIEAYDKNFGELRPPSCKPVVDCHNKCSISAPPCKNISYNHIDKYEFNLGNPINPPPTPGRSMSPECKASKQNINNVPPWDLAAILSNSGLHQCLKGCEKIFCTATSKQTPPQAPHLFSRLINGERCFPDISEISTKDQPLYMAERDAYLLYRRQIADRGKVCTVLERSRHFEEFFRSYLCGADRYINLPNCPQKKEDNPLTETQGCTKLKKIELDPELQRNVLDLATNCPDQDPEVIPLLMNQRNPHYSDPLFVAELITPYPLQTHINATEARHTVPGSMVPKTIPVEYLNLMSPHILDGFEAIIQSSEYLYPTDESVIEEIKDVIVIVPENDDNPEGSGPQGNYKCVLGLHPFRVETYFQLRGSNLPLWYPGMFTAFPDGKSSVKLISTPSTLITTGWKLCAPQKINT